MEYFIGTPPSSDKMWLTECASVATFCQGRGLDPGAGGRTLTPEMTCLDIRAHGNGMLAGDAARLDFADGAFDFVFTSHLVEHMLDPRAALIEWLRVVRPAGHVICIVPNTIYTLGQNTDPTPHRWEWGPRDFLREVLGDETLRPWFEARPRLDWAPAAVVSYDVACPRWSFHCVLEKR